MPVSVNQLLNRDVATRIFFLLLLTAGIGALIILSAPADIRWDSLSLYDLILLLFLIVSVVCIWLFSVSMRTSGRLDPFELPVWFSLTVFISIGLSGRTIFADPLFLHPRLQGDYSFINLALFSVLLGTLSLWLGYAAGLPRFLSQAIARFHRTGEKMVEIPRFSVIFIIYGLGIVVRLVMISSGSYSYMAENEGVEIWGGALQWLHYLDSGSTLAVVTLALCVFRGQAPRYCKVVLYVMILSEAFFTLLSGMKAPIITLLIVLVGCSLYTRKSISWKPALLLGLIFVLVIPINILYRGAINRGEINTSSFGDATLHLLQLSQETWLSNPLERNVESGAFLVRERQAGHLQNVALILYYTPEIKPYRDGRFYRLLPLLILVPRTLWPDKPVNFQPIEFSIEYSGQPSSSRTSATITPFGDLYINFGWPGIIVGMLVFGMIYRFFYEFMSQSSQESFLVLYLVLLLTLTNSESPLTGTIQAAFQGLVFYYCVVRLIYKRVYLDNMVNQSKAFCKT